MYADGRLKTTGRAFLAVPSDPPSNVDIDNSGMTFYLEEGTNTLHVRVKYADGTVKNGSIALT